MCIVCVCVYISKDLNIKEYFSEYEDPLGKQGSDIFMVKEPSL